MAVQEVMDFLENGNIRNSVNYPSCNMGLAIPGRRVTLLHKNVPDMIGKFASILSESGMNIANLTNRSKGEYAYTMIDTDLDIPQQATDRLQEVPGVLRIRVIR